MAELRRVLPAASAGLAVGLTVGLAAALLIAGCGSAAPRSAPHPSAAASTPSTSLSSAPPVSPGMVEVTGLVERGDPPYCLLLRAGDGTLYTFTTGDWSDLVVGARVTISGVVRTPRPTVCTRGTYLQVHSVRRA